MKALRLAAALLIGLCVWPVQAHLMAADQGTLNVVGDGAFLVLSVPVSVLEGVDDNGDGWLDAQELQAHWQRIEQQVQDRVLLHAGPAVRRLDGVMLSLAPEHEAAQTRARQLVVLGRFEWNAAAAHRLELRLLPPQDATSALTLTVTRGRESQRLRFTGRQTQLAF
jgi:hypothetical protein